MTFLQWRVLYFAKNFRDFALCPWIFRNGRSVLATTWLMFKQIFLLGRMFATIKLVRDPVTDRIEFVERDGKWVTR